MLHVSLFSFFDGEIALLFHPPSRKHIQVSTQIISYEFLRSMWLLTLPLAFSAYTLSSTQNLRLLHWQQHDLCYPNRQCVVLCLDSAGGAICTHSTTVCPSLLQMFFKTPQYSNLHVLHQLEEEVFLV